MKCPKCGLMQIPAPTCKSCGTAVEAPAPRPHPPAAPVRRPAPPPPPAAQVSTPAPPAAPPIQPPAGVQWKPPQAGGDLGKARRLSFHGAGGSLFGIHIVNVFLTLITLGIYSFWGRVKVRKYLLSETAFEGDRFAYHGTGRELLNGYFKAALVFGIPINLLVRVPELLDLGLAVQIVAGILASGIGLVFAPIAMVGARRYRLSRTSWRGIRLSFRGRLADFIKLFVKGSLLTTITLGFYYPFFETRRHGFLVSHSYFGNEKFDFDGNGRDLFWSYVIALLLSYLTVGLMFVLPFLLLPTKSYGILGFVLTFPLLLATLGLYWFWFLVKKQRYFWNHTTFGPARFHSTVTMGRLLLLKLGNLLLLIVTAGLGWSWVLVRNARFAFAYLTLGGALDLEAIQQEAQVASATGEGLSDFLSLDFDLG